MTPLNKATRLVLLCCAAALSAYASASAAQRTSTEPAAPAAGEPFLVYAVVTNRVGQRVNSLKPENFTVSEDGVRRQITFFSDRPAPASVAVLFDLSGSTPADALRQAAEAFRLLRRESLPENEYLLAAFNEKHELTADWTNRDEVIAAALDRTAGARRKGATALFDALHATVEQMNAARHRRRVLILFSDGMNNASRRHGFKEVRDLLKRSDTTLYVIGVGGDDGSPYAWHAHEQMRELASGSGGDALFLLPEGKSDSHEQPIYDAFAHVAADLRHQYTLGFEPAGGAGGKWRSIKISVDHPEVRARGAKLYVRARKGHYGPADPRPSPEE